MDTPQDNTRRSLLGDRMTASLLLGVVLLAVMGSLRPDKPRGMSPNAYWVEKISWRHCADMVIMGDSRSYMGISPAILNEHLQGWQIRNFGFNGNGFNPEYFQAATDVLDPQSPRRAIVLAVTPHSLTRNASNINQFVQSRNMSRFERFCTLRLSGMVDFFEPMSFRDAWFGLCPSAKPSHSQREYFADGWVATDLTPESYRQVRAYEKIFTTHRVDPEVVAQLLAQVQNWTAAGVTVYAFRMPACEQMIKLENTAGGFDEAGFVRSFEEAGGVWLTVNPTAYACYDGSHLRREAAETFSADLGRLIAARGGYSAAARPLFRNL